MVIKAIRPRTTRPAARVGLSPRRSSFPTNGLKTTARTAAKISGSTISLTAANAVTTMSVAATNPTKLQDQTPILGKEVPFFITIASWLFTRAGRTRIEGAGTAAPLDPVRKSPVRPRTP